MTARTILFPLILATQALSCAGSNCSAPLDLHVEATTLEDLHPRDPNTGEYPLGQLRGAVELRFSAPGTEPLVLSAPPDPHDMDLLGTPIRVQSLGPDLAVVLDVVSFGGGVGGAHAYLIRRVAGRLQLLDEMSSLGSSFLYPWEFESAPDGWHVVLAGCSGPECHHDSLEPATIWTTRWEISPSEFLTRHSAGSELRRFSIRADRFELDRSP